MIVGSVVSRWRHTSRVARFKREDVNCFALDRQWARHGSVVARVMASANAMGLRLDGRGFHAVAWVEAGL